jgi:hypothetical protein
MRNELSISRNKAAGNQRHGAQQDIYISVVVRVSAMKVLSVVGARPQFVKASVVSPALRKRCTEVLASAELTLSPNP